MRFILNEAGQGNDILMLRTARSIWYKLRDGEMAVGDVGVLRWDDGSDYTYRINKSSISVWSTSKS